MAPALHPGRDASLLSPTNYDDDASSIHSERSDQDTDSEDDEVLMGARSSTDIRNHDRSVLEEEEERDRLLIQENRRRGRRGSALAMVEPLKKLFSKSYAELPGTESASTQEMQEIKEDSKRARRKERRRRRKAKLLDSAEHGEDGQLMYEMEEGGMKEGALTGSSSEGEGSEEIDRQVLMNVHEEKALRRRRFRMWCILHLLIAVGFSILVLIAWKLSLNRKSLQTTTGLPKQKLVSNGTALFAPTTILISLDGFRADFLYKGLTPRIKAFVEEGVSPAYMLPSFPSVTFPNHYTLVTGLHPESHGVVGNTFWDDEMKEEFYYTHPSAMQSKWWGGEPLWVTAESQGIRSAIHMWPGSEAHIMEVEPAFLDKFNAIEPLSNKVSRVLELLDKPGLEREVQDVAEMRPQFIAAYVPDVDAHGHLYGPNSTQIRRTISDVDKMLDQIFGGLEARNLTNIVNVVVVSDHGMATTDVTRLIQFEDLVNPELIEHIDGWPLYGLRPKDPATLRDIYRNISVLSEFNPNFDVYLRDENMPERYHFSNNERIAPLWIVPKTGWAVVTKAEFDVAEGKAKDYVYHPRGLHGYDHEHPLMRAIFVARGPAFPHPPNSRVEAFQNIEVYNIICDSLGIEPKPNNGTLRLPLHTIGLHNPDTNPEEPQDPVAASATVLSSLPSLTASLTASPAKEATPDAVISISPIEASSAADPDEKSPSMVGVDPPAIPEESGEKNGGKSFWDWLTDEFNGLKDFFGQLVNADVDVDADAAEG